MPKHFLPVHVDLEARRVKINDRGVGGRHEIMKNGRYVLSGSRGEDTHELFVGLERSSQGEVDLELV